MLSRRGFLGLLVATVVAIALPVQAKAQPIAAPQIPPPVSNGVNGMYRLQYGVVVLDVTTVNSWDERIVTTDDGVDKLSTKIEGNLSTVWSPWTNGITPAVAGAATPGAAAKVMAALRRLLEEPRKQLIFSIPDNTTGPGSTNVLLMSPLSRPGGGFYPCDANNGPIIEVVAIREMQGEVTMIVDIKFTTWINEASTVRRMVSNRWSQIEELDDKFWSRRITSGVAYFRADAMRTAAGVLLSPDQFREDALPPVMRGFQRRAIRCEVGSDGLTLTYQVVDEQCALMPVNRKIARVHGYFGDQYSPATFSDVASGAMTGAELGAIASGGDPLGAAAGFIAGGISGAFPAQTVTLWLRVDGRPDATKADLVNALARMAAGIRVGATSLLATIAAAFIYTNSLTQSLDDDGIWAEMFIQYRGSVIQSAALAAFGLAPGASRAPLFNNANPDLNGLGDTTTDPNGMVALVPNSLGSVIVSGHPGAAGSGTPPSIDPTRNAIVTTFLRAPDVKGTEDQPKTITNTAEQRTNIAPGDSKKLASN